MKIALAQVNSTVDPQKNLAIIRDYTHQAAQQDARIVVFPEAMLANFTARVSEHAVPLDDPWIQEIQHLSDEYHIGIIAGIFTPSPTGKIFNTAIFTRPQAPLTYYHKIHLYDAFSFQESATISPGNTAVVCQYHDTMIGLSTCYDVRFSQLFTQLAKHGAKIIILIASWGAGEDKLRQWRLLVQARALDSGCWIVACDQAYVPPINASSTPLGIGHSIICSPYGKILVEMGDHSGIEVYDCDPHDSSSAHNRTGVITNQQDFIVYTVN